MSASRLLMLIDMNGPDWTLAHPRYAASPVRRSGHSTIIQKIGRLDKHKLG
ncbi:MAG: hypothetical protein ACJASS_002046 [Sulfitobacter sp.]|jgi:hypothetical protein